MNELVDLVEFNYDFLRKVFVKKQTHKTNVSKSIAYGEKKKILDGRGYFGNVPKSIRFKIVPNGQLQYSNCFKPTTL